MNPTHLQTTNLMGFQVKPILDISVVIPVYNEHESLRILHQGITDVMTRENASWEVIYVDDGSTDGSTEVLQQLAAEDPRVKVAVQRRNFGKSLALAVGFALVTGAIIVTLDA